MKLKYITIVSISVFLILSTVFAPSAYLPDDNKIFVITLHDASDITHLELGTPVNFTTVLKNYTNDTMQALNISQLLPDNLDLLKSPFGELVDGEFNMTTPKTIDIPTGGQLQILRGYANISYFEFSTTDLINGSMISWNFTVNGTIDNNFQIDHPTFKYFDHWPDLHTISIGNLVSIKYNTPAEPNPYEAHLPHYSTADVDWQTVLLLALAVIVIAVFTRVLYFRKPLL